MNMATNYRSFAWGTLLLTNHDIYFDLGMSANHCMLMYDYAKGVMREQNRIVYFRTQTYGTTISKSQQSAYDTFPYFTPPRP